MSGAREPYFGFKLEWLGTVIFPVVTAGFMGFLAVNTWVGKQDNNVSAFNELKVQVNSQLNVILAKLETMPLDRQRLDQAEARVRELAGQTTSLAIAVTETQRRTDVNTAEIANIKGASMAPLRR